MRWSPDGRWLAFGKGNPETISLNIVPAEGTRADVRTVLDRGGNFEWSPDSKRFAVTEGYEGRAGTSVDEHLFVVDRDGTNRVEVADIVEDAIAWSPDGTEIAHYGPRTGEWFYSPRRLMAVRPDGTGAREITRVDSWLTLHGWSADGDRLLYYEGATRDIRTVRRDGSAAGTPFLPPGSYPAGWSPAGDQLIRVDRSSSGNRVSIADSSGRIVRTLAERADLFANAWGEGDVIALSAMTPNALTR